VRSQGGALTWRAYNESDEGKINKKWGETREEARDK
jgi:hypothetical protein